MIRGDDAHFYLSKQYESLLRAGKNREAEQIYKQLEQVKERHEIHI